MIGSEENISFIRLFTQCLFVIGNKETWVTRLFI